MVPVMTANPSAAKNAVADNSTLTSNCCTMGVIKRLATIPSTPPRKLIAEASNRNSNRIFFLEQPIAFKIPISFVRSFTDTNKTFIIPIPPTTNTMTAIATKSIVNI